MTNLKLGKYRHFKGKEYEVIAVGRHSETLEEFVVYKALYDSPEFGKNAVWVRPLKMFTEHVEKEGYSGPRFKLVE
jgi:hypothetical protein